MRKNFLIGFVMLIVSIPTFAGDYLTNTNQNAAFLRMIAPAALPLILMEFIVILPDWHSFPKTVYR